MVSDGRRRWEALSRKLGGDGPPYDPVLVAAALGRLDPDERIALELRYVDEYSIEDAASFFELDRRRFLRLLSRARRRLLEEYQRLRDGLAALVGLLGTRVLGARRRAQAALARAQGTRDQGLARLSWFSGLSSLPVVEACSATLAVAAALALGAGLPARGAPPTPPRPVARVALAAVPATALRPVALAPRPAAPPAPAPPTLSRAGTPPPPALAPAAVAAAGARSPLAVGPLSQESGPEGRTTYQVEQRTLLHVGSSEVPSPEGLPSEVPDQPVDIGVGVFYHCPPPGERPPPQAVACPVLAP